MCVSSLTISPSSRHVTSHHTCHVTSHTSRHITSRRRKDETCGRDLRTMRSRSNSRDRVVSNDHVGIDLELKKESSWLSVISIDLSITRYMYMSRGIRWGSTGARRLVGQSQNPALLTLRSPHTSTHRQFLSNATATIMWIYRAFVADRARCDHTNLRRRV